MKQFQMIRIFHLHKRGDHLRIKLGIISAVDTVFQLFLCKICEELLHHLICSFLIRHSFKLFHRHIQLRDILRHEKPSVIGKPFQDCLGCRDFFLSISCTVV